MQICLLSHHYSNLELWRLMMTGNDYILLYEWVSHSIPDRAVAGVIMLAVVVRLCRLCRGCWWWWCGWWVVLRRGVVSDTCNTLLVLLSIGEGSQLSAVSVCHNDINNYIPTVILFTRHVIKSYIFSRYKNMVTIKNHGDKMYRRFSALWRPII